MGSGNWGYGQQNNKELPKVKESQIGYQIIQYLACRNVTGTKPLIKAAIKITVTMKVHLVAV